MTTGVTQETEIVEAGPNRPLALDDPAAAWLVVEGALDVFAVEAEDGPRFHVVRAGEGETVCGVPREGGLQLIAVAAPDTRLRRVEAGEERVRIPAMAELAEAVTGEAERARQRLERKAEAENRRVERSLRKLASALVESAEAAAGQTGDALFEACDRVGRALGVSFKQPSGTHRDPLAAIARASAVRYRQVVLKGDWWRKDSGPILAYLDANNHPVALIAQPRGGYRMFGPEGEVDVTRDVANTLNGIGYSFYRPFPEKALGPWDVFRFGIATCRSDLATMLTMGMLSGLLGMATPVATGKLFDSVIPGAERGQLAQIGVFLVLAAFCSTLFTVTRNFALLRLEGRMDATVQAAVWDRLLALPVPFFRQFASGDLAARSMAIDHIRRVLTGSALASVFSGVFSVFSFGLLFYYSAALAKVAVGATAVAVAVTLLAGKLMVRIERDLTERGGKLTGIVLELINGVAKFRVAGAERRAFAAWALEFSEQKRLAAKAARISSRFAVFNAMFPTLSAAAIFYFGAKSMADPTATARLSTGQFLAFNAAFAQFLHATLELSSALLAMANIVPAYERAKPILRTLPEVDIAAADPGVLSGRIEAQHLAFRYAADAPLVLKDITFRIEPGEFVAFVGPSGCGKSTLFRLLLGFEKPESGAIYLDGRDLAGLDIQAVRRQTGVVMQNSRLIAGDIYSNIVGAAPLPHEAAWEAAKMAGLDRDIRAMPMGMHTVVGESGGLSGGQRQRLLIARAIVHKPRLLLFDEATSALDNQTQAIVSRSLEALQVTRIVIAHRLSTIVNADRIFVLEGGRIAQCGRFQELMEQPGPFAELAKRQIA